MKVLITALVFAVLAYACQTEFASAQKLSEKGVGSVQTFASGKNNLPVKGSINVKLEGNTTAGKMIPRNATTKEENYDLFPSDDFLFVPLIMVN